MAANTQDTQQSHITVSCTAEFPSYKCDSVSKCWGLVTLKAANYEPEQSKRPALDIVAVIDRSGSMQGEKLFLVKKSLKFLVQNLLERDRLSVITYHTDVTVDFDLLPMNQNNKTYAKHKIESIQSASSTNLCGGLLQGLCSILDRGNVKNDVASVLLFTDGLANQGITAKDRIIRAMKDPKKYLNASDRETQDHDTLIQYQSNVTASVSSRGSASSRAIPNVYQPNVPNVPRRSFLSHMRNLFRSSNTSNVQQVQNRSDIQQNVVPPDTQNIQPAEETEVQPEIDKSSEQPAQALQQPLQVQNAEQQPEEKIKPATATGAVNQAENKEKNVVQITDASVYTFGFGRDHDPDMLKAISDAANGMYYFIENEEQISESFGHCFGGLVSTLGQNIKLNLELCDGVTIDEIHTEQSYTSDVMKQKWEVHLGDMESEEERDVLLTLNLPATDSSTTSCLKCSIRYFCLIDSCYKHSAADFSVDRSAEAEYSAAVANLAVDRQRNRLLTTKATREALELADTGDLKSARERLEKEIKRVQESLTKDDEFCKLLVKDMKKSLEGLQNDDLYLHSGRKRQMNALQMHSKQRSNRPDDCDLYMNCSRSEYMHKFK